MVSDGHFTGSSASSYYKLLDESTEYSSKAAASGAMATKMSRFSKLGGRAVPVVGAAIGFGLDVANGESADRAGAKAGGGLVGGMAAGAATGALVGSVVPGPGTAVGAFVGGVIGGFVGSGIGASIFDNGLSAGSVLEGAEEGVGELGSALGDVGSALNPFD
jgi:phage tail tape-measure protein